MPQGYYRQPTIYQDNVVFVSEDDLWSAPASGGIARRLTSNLGKASQPRFSPDGSMLAFVGSEEGQPEIYVMPASGGTEKRLTYLGGGLCLTAGWTHDGKIVFANSAEHWYLRFTYLYTIDPAGGAPQRLDYGLARAIAYGPNGGIVLGRNTDEPARWKRYRGGTTGQLWIDEDGSGEFRQLLSGLSNLTSPMWLYSPGEPGRIYFLSDHEGIGNLYSCLPNGEDLRRHTHHEDFYARNASTDGKRIVYHAGADLYLYDPETDLASLIPIEYHSPRVQRNRKFVNAAGYLEDWALHPKGQATAVVSRGKLFTFSNWEGPVTQLSENSQASAEEEQIAGVRYRLPQWLPDGKRLIAVTDSPGEETFVIFSQANGQVESKLIQAGDIGRPVRLAVNPTKDEIVFSNHRYELLWMNLESGEVRQIDRGVADHIGGFSWSPDGEWVAYSVSVSLESSVIKLWRSESGEITQLTQPLLDDTAPAFDPQGRYLYFLSQRTFNPVYDALHFELSFPRGEKPYLITLRKDLGSPFVLRPALEEASETEKDEDSQGESDETSTEEAASEKDQAKTREAEQKASSKLHIDLEGIQERIIAFPVPEGLYGRILGAQDGKVLYSRYPLRSALERAPLSNTPRADGQLLSYNFEEQKEEILFSDVTAFTLSADGRTVLYRSGNSLRAFKAGEKPGAENHGYNRKSGWIDLGRVKVPVAPGAEWRQMYREAWRLQRDQFWTPDMSQVDWVGIYDRYLPLIERVGCRSEFSDMMWEMQGELGTSHTYEIGGDYRPEPRYLQGFLGADFEYSPEADAWRITAIHQGDAWEEDQDSPLLRPGVNVQVGDLLLAINGKRLSRSLSPGMALVNLAGEEVSLTVISASSPAGDRPRSVIVETLQDEGPLRYRQWVNRNRQQVHAATQGRIGYVHIPDMGAEGFAEFHRGFLPEVKREGLIVDVRFNRGGHVSSLILEKLARRSVAYVAARWMQLPRPYPMYAIAGPIIALTNEFAGSDGDIFSHAFKLMKLGPLIGKRTWGGVIGINPSRFLVDGTVITQPEYAFWFSDVGWQVENYGTDPDIEVDILPQDYAQGRDPQLERAIAEAMRLLEANPPSLPDFSQKPSKAAPKLPPRKQGSAEQ
jgi:tricorn protease